MFEIFRGFMSHIGIIQVHQSLAFIDEKCAILDFLTESFDYLEYQNDLLQINDTDKMDHLTNRIDLFIAKYSIDLLFIDSEIFLMLPAFVKKQLNLLFFKIPIIIVITQIIEGIEEQLGKYSPTDIVFNYQSINELRFRINMAISKSKILNRFYSNHKELENTKQQLDSLNKQLEQSIEESNQMTLVAELSKITQSNFLANMSHEMRTPLNGILGIIHLLAGTSLNNEQKEFVDLINTSSENLLNLINDILDYSRIDAGKMTLRNEDFSLNEKIVKMLKTLTVKAHQKGIELIYEQDTHVPDLIYGDHARINQLLINLVGNSIKFTENGEIKVHVKLKKIIDQNHAILQFSVKDTGIGISEELLENIFEPFYQIEEQATKKYAGSGLGLAICKQLVLLLNGHIWVESELGKGSTFSFTIEIEFKKEPLSPMIDTNILTDKKVLVVDDSSGLRKYLRNILNRYGMIVDTAESEQESFKFLEWCKQSKKIYDIALIDLTLKDSEGWQIVNYIRQDDLLKNIKTIIITGLSEYNVPDYAKQFGIEYVLKKPITEQELKSIMLNLYKDNTIKMSLPPNQKRKNKRKLSILLVEDEAINRRFAESLLTKEGHQITIAVNGLEALDKYQTENFDLILMDIQMPEMNGIEASKKIREIEVKTGTHTPIIALTAYALQEELDKCISSGMDTYITKPINVSLIYQKIDELMDLYNETETDEVEILIPEPEKQEYLSFNYEEFVHHQCNDKDFMIELADMFIQVVPQYLDNIKEAILKKNREILNKSAHTLKGTLKTFWVKYAHETAQSLELLEKNASFDQAMELYNVLENQVADIVQDLEKMTQNLQ